MIINLYRAIYKILFFKGIHCGWCELLFLISLSQRWGGGDQTQDTPPPPTHWLISCMHSTSQREISEDMSFECHLLTVQIEQNSWNSYNDARCHRKIWVTCKPIKKTHG